MRCSLGLLALILVGGALADDNACSTCKWAARIFEDALCDVEANEFAVSRSHAGLIGTRLWKHWRVCSLSLQRILVTALSNPCGMPAMCTATQVDFIQKNVCTVAPDRQQVCKSSAQEKP